MNIKQRTTFSFRKHLHLNFSSLSRFVVSWVACLLLSVSFSATALAQTWKINLQDADVKAFITEVADITGKNFVLDPRVNGKVTVISNRALTKDEVYELFLGVLNVNGIVAVPSGNTTKLVPDNVAKQKGISVDLRANATGEGLVTRVINLSNTKAAEILPVVRPLLPQFAHVAAVPSVNALVVSDRASSLNELENLIQALDGGINDRLEVIPLHHTPPESMLELISSLTGVAGTGNTAGNSRLKVIADTNNDRLLVKGDDKSIYHIRKLVRKLDVKPSRRLSGLKVFKLKYASAAHIAEMLRGLLNYESLNSTGAQSTLQATSALSGGSSTSSSSKASGNRANTNRSSTSSTTTSAGTSRGISKPRFSIIADETQNAIVVNAPPGLMAEIKEAIETLDTRRAQVLIQAAIIEVSGDNVDQLGVQWAMGGPDSGIGLTNFGNTGASLTSLAAAAVSNNSSAISSAASAINGALLGLGKVNRDSSGQARFYGAILQAIKTTSSANLLSMPSILTLDNEEANILVGQNVPFITGSVTTTAGGTANPFQTIERKDVGINLTVIPHIGDGGTIRLEVSQEVSAVVPTASNIQSSDIITNRRLIKTTVLADDQQTIALGGLMSDDSNNSSSKVPLLGDIPAVGHLFRTRQKQGTKRNLIVFLQPTILHDGKALSELSKRRYDNLRFLQLELDSSGNLRKSPLNIDAMYAK